MKKQKILISIKHFAEIYAKNEAQVFKGEIIEELRKIKNGIEGDNFTRENIDTLIKKLNK